MIEVKPQREHQWLEQLVGEWAIDGEMQEPGKEPERFSMTERTRSISGLWVVAEGQVPMPDGAVGEMITTFGYDPRKQRYVGSFIGSGMDHLWLYEGTLDASGRVLTLETEGPSWSGDGSLTRFRDVYEIEGPGRRTMRSFALGANGEWQSFMTTRYRRTGA